MLFDYHGIPVYVRLGLGTETPELARFMGPKGILDAAEFDLRLPQRAWIRTQLLQPGFREDARGIYRAVACRA